MHDMCCVDMSTGTEPESYAYWRADKADLSIACNVEICCLHMRDLLNLCGYGCRGRLTREGSVELDIPDMFGASPFVRQQRSRRKRPDYGSAPSRYLHYDASERPSLPCYLRYLYGLPLHRLHPPRAVQCSTATSDLP